MIKKLDKETLYSILCQLVNILAPFILLKLNFSNFGASTAINYEVLLSIVAFFSIWINFSSSTFLSISDYTRHSARATYFTIVCVRAKVYFLTLILLLLCMVVDEERLDVYLYSAIILATIVFETQFYYIAKSKSYLYQLLILPRTVIPLFLVSLGFFPESSLVISYVASFTVQLIFFLRLSNGKFHIIRELYDGYISDYKLTTFTDVLASVFSQLDTYIVSVFLREDSCIIYITIRKLIRAIMSLLNYVFRSIFHRISKFGFSSQQVKVQLATTALYVILSYIGYISLWDFFVFELLSIDLESQDWIIISHIFSLVLIFGFIKSLIVHSFVYVNRLFKLHFLLTLVTALVYFLAIFGLGAHVDLIYLTTMRVLVDIVYVVLVIIFIRYKKKII